MGNPGVRLLLRPPIDCVFCKSRRFYVSKARGLVEMVGGAFFFLYRCHDCGRRFCCVSRSRVHWALRVPAALSFALLFLLLVAAVAWLAFAVI